MPECVEDRHCKHQSIHEAVQEAPLEATVLESAGYVVKQANMDVARDVLEKVFRRAIT